MEKDFNISIPVAIVIAGILIAGSLFYINKDNIAEKTPVYKNQQASVNESEVAPISEDDHILGNPNADIIIVEYSDTECPYCKQFHFTMHRIIDEYGKEGKVAWVYRHFPLPQLHKKAPKEAEATECAAELGGNPAFWKYIDRLFEITPSNDGLDPAELPQIAEYIGLNRTLFEECLDSGKYADFIEESYQAAVDAGGRGTPYNIMIVGKEQIEVPGAQPYETIKNVIDTILKKDNL